MNDSQLTDEELVVLSLTERNVFGVLIARYEARLTRYIRRLGLQDNEDQLDVLQEIFIKAYRNLNDFDTSLSFSSWIYRIAHNEAISWYRKRSVRPEGHLIEKSEELIMFLRSEEAHHEEVFDVELQKQALSEALQSINAKYRDVVILRFFEHKEYDEISDILRIPVGTVGTLLHRAKKQLRTILTRTHTP